MHYKPSLLTNILEGDPLLLPCTAISCSPSSAPSSSSSSPCCLLTRRHRQPVSVWSIHSATHSSTFNPLLNSNLPPQTHPPPPSATPPPISVRVSPPRTCSKPCWA